MAKYKFIRHIFRNVSVSKDILTKLIASMDKDEDGRISLAEFAVALKLLWKQAMGKVKAPKTKVLD